MVIIDLVFSKLTFCTVLQFPGLTMEDDKENVNVDVSGEEVNRELKNHDEVHDDDVC